MSTTTTPDSLNLVIFGATGDLTRHKLLPALFDLFQDNNLPQDFSVTAFSRQDLLGQDYRELANDCLSESHPEVADNTKKDFLSGFTYCQGNFKEAADFAALKEQLASNRAELVLFYVAASPTWYDTIFRHIHEVGLHALKDKSVRICIEKPFGRDLETARRLDQELCKIFSEEQIFRIDHYLAKQALENILTFRFTNRLFAHSWDHESIEAVKISFHEDNDATGRGTFYDDIGALRDVGQNHLLQLLAAVAMENPGELAAEPVRAARAAVLEDLRIYQAGEVCDRAIRAQYKGYTNTDGVASDSSTETYFKLEAHIDNDRWQGVPFYLESGKALSEKRVEIEITFRPLVPCVCGADGEHDHRNILTIRLAPEAQIDTKIWVRSGGVNMEIVSGIASFDLASDVAEADTASAYEKILFDAIRGDQLLFTTGREVQAAWQFITPILTGWQECPLPEYEPGTGGPKEHLSRDNN